MSEVIGAELSFKSVFGAAFGTGHDACVGDEDVELGGLGEEFFGASADAGEGVEVEFEEMDIG